MVAIDLKRVEHRWGKDRSTADEPYAVAVPRSVDELDFVPQAMVGWYSPKELVKAGLRALVSATFGSYADKREIVSVLEAGEWQDYSAHVKETGEIWIDYVADLGDGFDATYTIASLLAAESLSFDPEGQCIAKPPAERSTTRRGDVLIMGGDQVYPTANQIEYQNRLIGPFRSALPSVDFVSDAPILYLVPGNHDWYDGLNSFLKLFCRGEWIGGWRTAQRRSYFAFKLDERLWVWGIDIQLSGNIDQPQINYFTKLAEEMPRGSRIILCSAEPTWTFVETCTWQEDNAARRETEKERLYHNLGYFEEKIVRKFDHDVLIALAGDTHNYARYEAKDGDRQLRFVSGGGGAYLYPTHNMPNTLKMPEKYGGAEYARAAVFPDEKDSRRLALSSMLFPFYRVNWSFSATLGAFYLLLAWVIQSVSKISSHGDADTLLETFSKSLDLGAFIKVIAHSPGSVSFFVVLFAGLTAFSGYTYWPKKVLHGLTHTAAHVGLFVALLYAIAQFNLGVLGLEVDEPVQVILFGIEAMVLGGISGGLLFGLYLWVSNRFLKLHDNEVLLCQSHPDYKNFLRFHVKRDGTVTIYPIGVKKVVRKTGWSLSPAKRALAAWRLRQNASKGEPWFEPEEGSIEDRAHLIETPVTISFRDSQPD